ncbi:MAG: hypothetical protein L3J62_10885 [Gammaproteobacteria bacterium]|nr:hypothetical protein [Gammaproteobacteria bacterium]MCF6231268.1 hypothetical protein [Gammaproteobacteria bacterium]
MSDENYSKLVEPKLPDPNEPEGECFDPVMVPFNPTDIDIVVEPKSLDALIERIRHKDIDMNADFQRHAHLATCGLSAEVSGESPSVRQDPKKKSEREFWLPKGRKVFCENHVKLQDGFRLHFYVSSTEKVIYIAYLGPHLTS